MLDPMPTFGSQHTTTPSRKTGIPPTLLWIGCGSCSGESMAILRVDGQATCFLYLLEPDGVRLLWPPSLSLQPFAPIGYPVLNRTLPPTPPCRQGPHRLGPN